jgi:hypothetical protein
MHRSNMNGVAITATYYKPLAPQRTYDDDGSCNQDKKGTGAGTPQETVSLTSFAFL